jgi:hypothetical protein
MKIFFKMQKPGTKINGENTIKHAYAGTELHFIKSMVDKQ